MNNLKFRVSMCNFASSVSDVFFTQGKFIPQARLDPLTAEALLEDFVTTQTYSCSPHKHATVFVDASLRVGSCGNITNTRITTPHTVNRDIHLTLAGLINVM